MPLDFIKKTKLLMKEMKIIINKEEYVYKQSFRSYMLFEEMTGKQIGDVATVEDILTLLFCTLKGCNKHWDKDWDTFIDLVDEDNTILTKFNDFNTSLLTPGAEKKRKKVSKSVKSTQ